MKFFHGILLACFLFVASFSSAAVPECNINGMIFSPSEEPYATQWRMPYCLNLLTIEVSNLIDDEKEALFSALSSLPSELRENSRLKEQFDILNAAVSNRKKYLSEPLPTEDECTSIYNAVLSNACSKEPLAFDKYDWFNPVCLQVTTEFLRSINSIPRKDLNFILAGFNEAIQFPQCCELFPNHPNKTACDQRSRNREISLGLQNQLALFGVYFYTMQAERDGRISTPVAAGGSESPKEETMTPIELSEVVVVGPSRNPTEAAVPGSSRNRTEAAVIEYFRENPVEGGKRPGRRTTGSAGAGEAGTVSPEECLELENISRSSTPCLEEEFSALFASSSNPSWAKPACLTDINNLLQNDEEFNSLAAPYGGELAFLNRLLFVNNEFNKDKACRKGNPNESYRRKVETIVSAIKTRGQKYKQACKDIDKAAKSRTCATPAETLMSSGSERGNPVCISKMTEYFESAANGSLAQKQFITENWTNIVDNVQMSFHSFFEYKSCVALSHIKRDTDTFDKFKQAEHDLMEALSSVGVKFDGEAVRGVPFVEDEEDGTDGGNQGIGDGSGEETSGDGQGMGASGGSNEGGSDGSMDGAEDGGSISDSGPWGNKSQNWDSSLWIGLGVGVSEEYINAPVDIVTDED